MSDKDKKNIGKILLEQRPVKQEAAGSLFPDPTGDKQPLPYMAPPKAKAGDVDLLKALSKQYGIPATNLREVEIRLDILSLIPQDIAKKHIILPFAATADSIYLVMANPGDRRIVDEIEFVSGKKIFPHVGLQAQIQEAITACYSAYNAGEKVYRAKGPRISLGGPEEAIGGGGRGGGGGWNLGDQGAREKSPAMVVPESTSLFDDDLDLDLKLLDDDEEEQGKPAPKASPPQPQSRESAPRVPPMMAPPSGLSEPSAFVIDYSDGGFSAQTAAQLASEPTLEVDLAALKKAAEKKRILVVDDESDITLLISKVLSDKGYDVITASRGFEAIKKLQSERLDMVILDAMLPEVHGFEICKKMKSSQKYGHIPIIMISAIYRGWRYAHDLKQSYGVDDFIEKPFKIGDLVKTVEKYANAAAGGEEKPYEALSREAENSLAEGIEAYRNGDIDKAIDLLKRGVEIDPLAYKLHYHLALLLGKNGKDYEAIRELENVLELEPNDFSTLKNLAVLYQKAGFKLKAIETWERALATCDDEKTRDGIKRQLVTLL